MVVCHITYATRPFRRSARELKVSARRYGLDTVIHSPRSRVVRALRKRHPEIMSAKVGAGYWLWKPALILDALHRANDGDVVLYTDAAATMISDPQPMLSLADTQPIVLFEQGREPGSSPTHPMRAWTKRDCFVLLNADGPPFWDSQALTATFQVYRACGLSRRFVREWFEACQDRRILTDDPNTSGLPDFPEFRAHRHDQSVLSILAIRHGVRTYQDPSQWGVRTAEEPFGQVFDHHRRRSRPMMTVFRKLRLRKRLRGMIGRTGR